MAQREVFSVGLGGDGDEVSAIAEVERVFAVCLAHGDALGWRTAGDLFRSLLKVMPEGGADEPGIWEQFAAALTQETGADPSTISADSPLLAEPLRRSS